ncbi:MAG: immunoglobulin-like domain-containing protein [Myxococcota bacterium]
MSAQLLACGDDAADAAAPVITLRGNAQIEVAFGAVFGDLGAVALDEVDGELSVSVAGDVDTSMPGTYQLTYTATDSDGNTATATRDVVVLEDEDLTSSVAMPANPAVASFFDGRLCEADYWSDEPEILSAGLGFSDIIGVVAPAMTEEVALAAGGAWSGDVDCGTDQGNYTSTTTQDQVGQGYIMRTPYGPLKDGALGIDGLPIVFSWPVVSDSIDLEDFQVTMNTGDIVRPLAVSTFPNFECNERNTLPIFGEFGNRLPSDDPDTRYPAIVSIVGDLFLVGPGGTEMNARGLTWENEASPYDENNGPRFVGAKLNRIDGPMEGEGVEGPAGAFFPPNDAWALYGEEAEFMVRTLSTGGVSPNGTSGVTPDDFERFFRLHATGEDGSLVIIDQVGVDYAVRGGTLRVLGLSDLGQREDVNPYDACYDEDLDNYIDIILAGDEAAARSLTHVEVPSLEGGYDAFYNPGGPGRTPFEGVTYTEPGPADLEPVIIALDDPMRVSYDPESDDVPDEGVMTLDVDGVQREFLLTVPESYSDEVAVPLLFNLHQLQGTAQEQLSDSQFDVVAEREGFIVVTPQAVMDVWTVTGFPLGGGADDFAFITALIDELSATYTIDSERIYATGMSQGGFLAFDLACSFGATFAAIAPVSGVMTPPMTTACAPGRRIPVLQTHGTADDQIDYEASQTAVQWWVDFNGASATPEINELSDPFPDNGTTVDRFVYAGGETGVDVEHLRINGGGHVWPGSEGDSDIQMAEEIWSFLSRYDLNGRIGD